MNFKAIVLLLAFPVTALATSPQFLSPDEIHKQLTQPDIRAKKALPPRKLQKLEDVIPKDKLDKLKAKKLKRQQQKLQEQSARECPHEPTSIAEILMPSAYAMGCARATVEPTPTSTPTQTPSATPSPSPSASPSPNPANGIDLRAYDTPIKEQFGGTCTAFGLAAAIENSIHAQKELSERHLWNMYQQFSVYSAMTAALAHPITELKYWISDDSLPTDPNYLKYAKTKLVKSTELEDNLSQVTTALAAGKPVYVGMSVPTDLASCRTVIRNTTTVTSGGHALAVVGFKKDPAFLGGAYIILKNSWGPDCGDHGYLYFPIGLCDRSDMYCIFWSIDSVTP